MVIGRPFNGYTGRSRSERLVLSGQTVSRLAPLERQGNRPTPLPLASVHQIDLMQSSDRVAGFHVVRIQWLRQPGSRCDGRAVEGGDHMAESDWQPLPTPMWPAPAAWTDAGEFMLLVF